MPVAWGYHRLTMGSANQAITPGRSTLLEAVNTMLGCIGEQPVNTLDGEGITEAAIAERILLEAHREGQVKGWSWNLERGITYPRNGDGEIVLPANVVKFVPDIYELGRRYVVRGRRVYDLDRHTFALDVTELKVDVVALLSWDDSPEAYNRWVTIKAAKTFAGRMMGSDSLVQLAAMDEAAALNELLSVEYEVDRPNALSGAGFPYRPNTPVTGMIGRRPGRSWH